jgi:ribulose-phosphate 3-epimerase
MSPFLIAASILSADFTDLRGQIAQAESAGIDWVHVDVMDGHFVPNITMGPFIVEACRRVSHLPIDVHLMIDEPDRYLQDFARAGANRLSVHIEGQPNVQRTLQEIRDLGCEAGIVLNPGTPAYAVDAVLPFVDSVLVMSVNPGFSGQTFIPQVLPKIGEIQRRIAGLGLSTRIEVDGGINRETLPLAYAQGATIFVAASAIFKYPGGISAGVQSLRQAA